MFVALCRPTGDVYRSYAPRDTVTCLMLACTRPLVQSYDTSYFMAMYSCRCYVIFRHVALTN